MRRCTKKNCDWVQAGQEGFRYDALLRAHCVSGTSQQIPANSPFTQNSGHPRLLELLPHRTASLNACIGFKADITMPKSLEGKEANAMPGFKGGLTKLMWELFKALKDCGR